MAITSKEINLFQLDQELGSQGLCGDFVDPKKKIITVADNSTVKDTELDAAIKAHVARPNEQELRLLNRQEGLVKLKELGFTDNQITALLS